MISERPHFRALLLITILNVFLVAFAGAESYNLNSVKGITAFRGSSGARDLLAKNGFVVADPAFKQIFEPYIESPRVEESSEKNPMGVSLPSFITTDSAWHTYHVLLEEGVKELEEAEAQRLMKFSRQLLSSARARETAPELVLYASAGLALQDEQYRQSLAPEEKRIVDGLRNGASTVGVPIGFPLLAANFRAQSFYTQSPELSDYFSARQWYASVLFRLSDAHETRLATALSRLVSGNPELLATWKQLSEPFDSLLAPVEDGTIRQYADAAASVLGSNSNSTFSDSQAAEIQSRLRKTLALPLVNDQYVSPEEYREFGKVTIGFRLLLPRQLPDAVCFMNTVEPRIPNRLQPSGLDFFAASPTLRSPAAVRAVQNQFGKEVSSLILKADCGPIPESLHGQAMHLLALLQEPLPSRVPPALRTEAWQDLQLWTQLGAWAEQRHTWALHSKLSVMTAGMVTPPKGVVAPYPEFFSGLAKLTRQTAVVLRQAGLDPEFEPKTIGAELLKALELSRSNNVREQEKQSFKMEQLVSFENQYREKHQTELETTDPRNAFKQMEADQQALARRALDGTANSVDIETLRLFFNSQQSTIKLINDFAPICDRLAELARKSLNNIPLTEEDAKWIEGYGMTLAGFNFYYGDSFEVPRDDFPIVSRVFSDPVGGRMLYAGLARPQALYVILADGKSLQLYRGAVMTYREFARSNDKLLDDDTWREMVGRGETPPAPPFTRSFYAETGMAELLKRMRAWGRSEDANLGDLNEIIWQIGSRATEKDLPLLLEVLAQTKEEGAGGIVDGMAETIAKLPWEPYQKQLVDLLASPDNTVSGAAARILISRPAGINAALLISGFPTQPPRTRRFYCAILSRLPKQTEASRKLLLQAVQDPVAGVRWQAAFAIKTAGWIDEQSTSALLNTIDDKNTFVGAAAARVLGKMEVTNEATALFEKLKKALQSTPPLAEDLEAQAREIRDDFRGEENHAVAVLDPDRMETHLFIEARVAANLKRIAAGRFPPMPIELPGQNYGVQVALIEAMADLRYLPAVDELFRLNGTDYEADATRALAKLAPDRVADKLIATAKDQQLDSYLREKALVTLAKIGATNRVADLIALLDDTTPIVYSRSPPGMEMRVCDRAASTIGQLLGWEDISLRSPFLRPDQREANLARARQWAKQSH